MCADIYTGDAPRSSDSKFFLRVLGTKLGGCQGMLIVVWEPRGIVQASLLKKGNYEQTCLLGNFGETNIQQWKSFLTALHISLVHKASETQNKTMGRMRQLAGRSPNS